MTAHELARELLEGPDLPVHFAYNYGDYWRTTVAPKVTEVTEGTIVYSDYHRMYKWVDEDDQEGDYPKVVILQ